MESGRITAGLTLKTEWRREEGGASCGKTAENNRTDNCKRRMRGRIEERRGCLVEKLW